MHPVNNETLISASLSPIVSPAQRDSIQLLKILGLILEDATPSSIPEKIISAVLDSLKGRHRRNLKLARCQLR